MSLQLLSRHEQLKALIHLRPRRRKKASLIWAFSRAQITQKIIVKMRPRSNRKLGDAMT